MPGRQPTRRSFLTGAAATLAAAATPAWAARRSATDLVPLGNSGVKVTRLAFGTGTFGGRIQRELGQDAFTRLVRHAYERGIRFFETADSYRGMPQMLAEALKGVPRDSYQLMTKMRWRGETDPRATMDRFRKDLNTDYFDILLMHCVRTPGWRDELARLQEELSQAKHRQVLRAHGASCHGLLPLRAFPGHKWLDVALLRINHDGTRMDTLQSESNEKGEVPVVTETIARLHAQGTGVLGMKLIGEGQFTRPEQRDAALRYVMRLGTVDAVTIGFKSPAEIDEAIERINTHLNA
jgi:aryl-alcohol dehydrogenase-like predicted oxidoreductase